MLCFPIGQVSEFVLSRQTEAEITERPDQMLNRLLGRYIVLDYFYAPNFEEDEKAYCQYVWACPCVRASVGHTLHMVKNGYR